MRWSRMSKLIHKSYGTTRGSSSSAGAQQTAPTSQRRGEVRSWVINSYGGGPCDLQLETTHHLPILKDPSDVLIQVHSASINPIDIAISKGYGATTLNLIRRVCSPASVDWRDFLLGGRNSVIEFPLTLGRDFAGRIVHMGHSAKGKYGLNVGDEVYGVVGVQRHGSHATLVVAAVDTIRKKPKTLCFPEAASIPYVGCTTWAAIRVTGGYCSRLDRKRFLVLGGSGGMGTFAVQYLKSLGAEVISTCSKDAEPLLLSLGSDAVVDYKSSEYKAMVKHYGPYDCILNLCPPENVEQALETVTYLKPLSGQYITLTSPFLRNMDNYGMLGGAGKNVVDLLSSNVFTLKKGSGIAKWAFFIPFGNALEEFSKLLLEGRIRPVIHREFSFDQAPTAYKAMEEGHLRGKVVLNVSQ